MNFYNKTSGFSAIFLMFYVCMLMFIMFFMIMKNYSFNLEMIFFHMNSSFISFPIYVDWVSITFSMIVCFISSCVMVFTHSYMATDPFIKRFSWIVMLFVLSMNFLVFIPSLISLLLGWDGLGLVSFCLVIYYQNPKSLGAGVMTGLMNRIGDVAILMSIGWVASEGHWNIFSFSEFWFSSSTMIMILIAGMTKSAQIPFCSWLPAAMAAPTPVSALVHSSTLVTAGVFLLIRFYPFLSSFWFFNFILLIIGTITMTMAGIAANYEMDLKKIIALSTLSQLGVMMMSIGSGLPLLSLMHLFTHAMFKALLFLCAGSIIHSNFNNQDIRKMSQLWSQMPLSSSCMNIANLALCGFPFMAGFYSKDLIIEMMIMNQLNLIIMFLLLVSTMLTVMYTFRLSFMILWSEMKQMQMLAPSDDSIFITLPIIMLTIAAITGGCIMSWSLNTYFPMIFIATNDKILALFISLAGGIMMMMKFYNKQINTVNFLTFFLSRMWFMTDLSNNLSSKNFLQTSFFIMKYVDLGWLEIMEGEGIFMNILFLTKNSQMMQKGPFNFFVSLMIMSMSVVIVLLLLN
uniref:NADH-ubiquinone oxidoreductase chain 5 n=1 Tax=Callochiton steinenii TaxID=2719128 RepID=A0A6H1PGB2_9MOLL|nr:NADH dehydrogenase subunit 5 [Callochiton steinenii]